MKDSASNRHASPAKASNASADRFGDRPQITTATAATLACLWEATASKPGNVNRHADFADLTLVDFQNSAVMIGQAIEQFIQASPNQQTLGNLILSQVRSTRLLCPSNSNLGISLLFAPLVMGQLRLADPANDCQDLQQATQQVLQLADSADTALMYQAIRLANPGGIKSAPQKDVNDSQPLDHNDTPVSVMSLAADRDSIASEYTTGFDITFNCSMSSLVRFQAAEYPLHWSILGTYIELLSQFPDSLIERKLGRPFAEDVSTRAGRIAKQWNAGQLPSFADFQETQLDSIVEQLSELDFYLRADGNRRNPGTTADLIAAGLFAGLLTGQLSARQSW